MYKYCRSKYWNVERFTILSVILERGHANLLVLNSMYNLWPYLTGNTLRISYEVKSVNAVYGNSRCCENYTGHTNTLCGQKTQSVPHRKHIMSRYKAQPVNAVQGNSRCLLLEPYGTHKYTPWAETQPVPHRKHYVSVTKPNVLMQFCGTST
jgi:hypothetical protein